MQNWNEDAEELKQLGDDFHGLTENIFWAVKALRSQQQAVVAQPPNAGTSGDAGAAGGWEAWDGAVQHLRTDVHFHVLACQTPACTHSDSMSFNFGLAHMC